MKAMMKGTVKPLTCDASHTSSTSARISPASQARRVHGRAALWGAGLCAPVERSSVVESAAAGVGGGALASSVVESAAAGVGGGALDPVELGCSGGGDVGSSMLMRRV